MTDVRSVSATIALCACALLLALTALAAAPRSAGANPDCGNMTWKGKSYWFSAGGVACKRGRVLMRRYLDHGTVPAGFRCSTRYAPNCWHKTADATFLKLTSPH